MLVRKSATATYYYRSRRDGQRVVREYVARGQEGENAAASDQHNAIERANNRRAEAARLDEFRGEGNRVGAVLARANVIISEVLLAAGWHQHKRQWRRQRGLRMATNLESVMQTWVPSELCKQAAGLLDEGTLLRAATGDQSTKAVVEKYLDHPAVLALWGDAGRVLLSIWVARAAGKNLITQEALLRFASHLRTSLVGSDPDILVRLLAERVVIAWVGLNYFESWYARSLIGELTFKQHEQFQRMIAFAQRQFTTAAKTLAKVRRAKLPDVLALVNIQPV